MSELILNAAQRDAVEYSGGPLLVLAGAGSGKTRVLTSRIAHLVERRNVPPHRILAVTFTNRAAGQMRERVANMLGRDPAGLWIGTFHSVCARLLRREAPLLGFTSQFTIYDEGDRMALIKRLLEKLGHSHRTFAPRKILSIISAAKNRMVPADELAGNAEDRVARVAAAVYQELTVALRASNAMDFDDLLLHPLAVFDGYPDRREYYGRRFDAVLVDEFQDTNRAQYLFVKNLSESHRDICVVGDDDQSIYSWRGADVRNMLDFQADFPDTTVVRLEENYRSTQAILDAANGVIEENRQRLGKTLFTSRIGGDPVIVTTSVNERDEAEWIVRELRERNASDSYRYRDMAVLYRTNAQSRAVEEAFRRASVPYRIFGAASFYQRREVKDLIAYLRLLVNPADNDAFLRAVKVPKRGIGPSTLAVLEEAAVNWSKSLLETAAIADRVVDLRPHAKAALTEFASMFENLRPQLAQMPPVEVLDSVIESIDYESYLTAQGLEGVERLENVRELVAGAAEWSEESETEDPETPLELFLANAALIGPSDNFGGDPEGVNLMTVHTAKGLEWPIVVVAGLEEGLFPLGRALETEQGGEEERRLAYVAITRAQDRTYLTWARTRRRGGQLMPGRRSHFLEALPPGVIEERRSSGMFGGEFYNKRSKPSTWIRFGEFEPEETSQDMPRYVKGERVWHRRFGAGTIKELSGHGRDLKVVICFDDDEAGTKKLLAAYAGLERDFESA